MFAPGGRDAALAQHLLRDAGFPAEICETFETLYAAPIEQLSFIVLADEAARGFDLTPLIAWLEAQASWSDLPLIVLTRRGGGVGGGISPSAARLADALSNVTFLERPFHPATFISVARSAWKGRQRQFEAKAQLERLFEGEQRLEAAMQAGNLGAWEFDVGTQAVTTSPIYKSLLGRTADEELTHQDFLSSVHPEDFAWINDLFQRSLAAKEGCFAEYRVIWPDGSVHWLEGHARYLPGSSGSAGRLVGVTADISERKRSEQSLQQTNEILEQRVAARTAELEDTHQKVLAEIEHREKVEEQLHQAQKMEMIGQLTGGVAHDFNNLLMAVLGNLELLRKHLARDPQGLRLIEGALQGAQRGAALTQRLLAFARRQTLQVEPAHLGALVLNMRDLIERSVGPTIETRFDVPADLPAALIDSNQIELALLNLAVNARDAMPDGGVLRIELDQIAINGADDLALGDYVRISVIDSGAGMDADTLERAVEPFFSTKELGKGTGLGLSMIHGLAQQLNGALRLSSEVGLGTRAELYMPATTEAVQQAPALAERPAEAPPRAGATILLVDDDPLIAMSTVDMLEDLGHTVIEAHSGAKALEALQRADAVDLMITDFAMPGMNGAQLADAVRVKFPGLPVLLATGYAELPSGARVDLPMLGKPYSQAQLAIEISKLLSA